MTPPVLLYLLKANLALALCAAAHFGLLRRLTFFTLNRFYLVLALLFSAVCPALPVPALPPLAGPAFAFGLVETASAPAAAAAGPVAPPVDWAAAGLAVYAAGAAVLLARLLARLLVQLLSRGRLRRTARRALVHGPPVRALAGPVSPFSFWQPICLTPDQHAAAELAAVLRHGQVHVRQWHTLDVRLAHLAAMVAWCTPAAWLLRRALLGNVEYLADRAALQTGIDRQAYQYCLLRLGRGVAGPGLVSPVTFFALKNRIVMMNRPSSAASQRVRYFLAVPLVLGLALGVTAAQARKPAALRVASQSAAPGPATYDIDGKPSDKATADKRDLKSLVFVNVLDEEKARRIFGAESGGGVVVVTSQNQNSPEVLALNEKLARVAPWVPGTETPAEVNVLVPAALAYITKTSPNSRIIGVTKLSYPSTGQVRYKVQLAEGRRPHYAFFDEQGNASRP